MFFSKRFRLAWLIGLMLFGGILFYSISNYILIKDQVRETILENALPLTSGVFYAEIQKEIIQPALVASIMSKDIYLRDWVLSGEKDETQIRRYLQNILKDSRISTSYFISDKTRKYYYEAGVREEIREEDPRNAWYFEISKSSAPFVINIANNISDQNQLTAFINYRVFDDEGSFIGVAGVGLRIDWVNQALKKYKEQYHHDIFFLRQDGGIRARSNGVDTKEFNTIYDLDYLNQYADDILAGKIQKLLVSRDGASYYMYIRFLTETNSFLVVGQYESVLLNPLRKHLIINVLIALLVSFVVCLVCVYIIQRSHQKLEVANMELAALNREKDEFLGIVAHDLKTPLHGILGLCDVAEMDIEDESFDSEPMIRDLRDISYRMLNLIHRLLDVSYIEASQGEVALQSFSIYKSVSETFSEFVGHAKKKELNYRLEWSDEEKDIRAINHAEWISICVSNLISNAIKYSPKKGSVVVSGKLNEENYELSIRDTGVGIPKDEMDRLFGKFERLSSQPTGDESSNGLGLYIVKKMCDKIGVKIEVESTLKQGSCFSLLIPLK